jgi:hypothetical protein
MYPDLYKFATPRFRVWSSNEQLITSLHSAVSGACYITRGRDQGSLNRDATIVGIPEEERLSFKDRGTSKELWIAHVRPGMP